MTLQFLTQKCYVYSEASRNWYFPSRSKRAVHNKIFNALNSYKTKSEFEVNGIQEVAEFYHIFCRPIPVEHLPNGVFSSLLIVTTLDDKKYYIFTDIEQLY